MSFDLAVWAGDRPVDDEAAVAAVARWDASPGAAAAPELLDFLDDLTGLFPVPGDEDDPAHPWSVWPLDGAVVGDGAYLPIRWDRTAQAVPLVVARARARGLHCFDPQDQLLLTPRRDRDAVLAGTTADGVNGRRRWAIVVNGQLAVEIHGDADAETSFMRDTLRRMDGRHRFSTVLVEVPRGRPLHAAFDVGAYVQCAGAGDAMTCELRVDREVRWLRYTVAVHADERLSADEVAAIFATYVRAGEALGPVHLRELRMP
jgi:hypothetical protein